MFLLKKDIKKAIPIFGHILWDFPMKLFLLLDYTKPFFWTLFCVFWIMFYWMTSFLLVLSPSVFFLMFLSFLSPIATSLMRNYCLKKWNMIYIYSFVTFFSRNFPLFFSCLCLLSFCYFHSFHMINLPLMVWLSKRNPKEKILSYWERHPQHMRIERGYMERGWEA